MKPVRTRWGLMALLAAAGVSICAIAATSARADTTIGADVNQAFNYTGACNGGGVPANRPCTVVNLTTTPARTMQSPCDGTVTRFRLNGTVTANTYRVRAVTDNGNGTYTPTATSSPPVTISNPGVNEYAASMPIRQGQYVGIDFMDDPVAGLRGWGGPGFLEAVFYTFPADGTPDTPFPDSAIYLYNADVACAPPAGSPQGASPSPKCSKGTKSAVTAKKKGKKKKGCAKKKKKKTKRK